MTDCCILGAGIIGLSVARELAGRGLSVCVVARDRVRDTTSWAASGIFPPAPTSADAAPNERLTAFSDALHRRWAVELRDETGIDNELDPCGGLHVAEDGTGATRLAAMAADLRARGVRCESLTAAEVAGVEGVLAAAVREGRIVGGLLVPDEMRIRPPRHLAALEASCRARGVRFVEDAAVRDFVIRGDRIAGAVLEMAHGASPPAAVTAERYCLAAGAWSGPLAARLGMAIETRPIRGQIALLRLPAPLLHRVINVGLSYLVPRTDGRLLAGSTLEDVGFDASTTPETIDRLLAFAHRLLGPLPDAVIERSWAGLRPASADGLPYLGRVPGFANAFIAAGHFRAGLHQSTGTAVLLADLMSGRPPILDPLPYDPGRRPVAGSPGSLEAMLRRAAEES